MTAFTMLSGANPGGDEMPDLPEPPIPSFVTARDGIPVIYGEDSIPTSAVRVVHPTNPAATPLYHSAGIVFVPPHAKLPNHFHAPEETFVILSGSGELTHSAGVTKIAKGDFIYLPPWAEHAIENTGTESLSFIVITAPANP